MNRFNVLIVDDVPKNIYSLSEVIRANNNNINVIEASSGEECLWALLKKEIDIIVMDINMPNMNGFETAQFIQSTKKTKHIPIIFITATNQDIDIDLKCYDSGGIDIIYKPINPKILVSKLNLLYDLIHTKKLLETQVIELKKLNEINKQMKQKIEEIATTDFLTEIPNRRQINMYCDALSKNAQDVTMMMIDLDNFKQYNDLFGHQKGDIALRAVAEVINNSLDETGFVGRYGGEEFLAIFTQCPKEKASEAANNIITNIHNLKLNNPGNQTRYLTASIGIAHAFIKDFNDLEVMINHADQALYNAKNSGKNCYRIYE